jgi:hypothetical protein
MFSLLKKVTDTPHTQDHARHGGGCCGGAGHTHDVHDTERDAASAAGLESSARPSETAAGENQHGVGG